MSRNMEHNVRVYSILFVSFYFPVFPLLWIGSALLTGGFLVDFVCVVEVECFLGEVGGVGWRRGFGFWVLINVVVEI